jgi:hypothetical protein
VDAARWKRREKHGGNYNRADLDALPIVASDLQNGLVSLDDALTRLAEEDSQAAKLVELHHFAGMSIANPDGNRVTQNWIDEVRARHKQSIGCDLNNNESGLLLVLSCRPLWFFIQGG